MSYVPNIDKIKEILSQGTYSLVDEFEEEILKHFLEKETDSVVISACRSLVRKAFYITIVKHGKEATILNFCEIVLNINGYGRKVCMELSRMCITEVNTSKISDVVSYFLDEYYTLEARDTSEYDFCIPVRYICGVILDSELIANGVL